MATQKTNTPKPRNCYSPRVSVISPAGHTPAQQQFKEDCDINTIMKRLNSGQMTDYINKHQLAFGFATPLQYHDSMNLIAQADSMFNELPSSLRNEFDNNPQAFLEFVQDEKNAAKAKELGIELSPEAAQRAAEQQEVAKPDEEGATQGQEVPASDQTQE